MLSIHRLAHLSSTPSLRSPAIRADTGNLRALSALAVAMACLAVLFLLIALSWPLSPDHGIMGEVGHVWLNGGLPFRDAWDTKGPVAYFPFLVAEQFFGTSALAIRASDAILLVAVALVTVFALRSDFGDRVAIIVAASYVMMVLRPGYTDTAQPDAWVAYFSLAVAAVSWHVRLRSGPALYATLALCGIGIGLSSMIKPFFPVLAALPIGILWSVRRDWRTLGMSALVLSVSVVSAIGAVALYFVARGGWEDLVASYIGFSSKTYAATPRERGGGWIFAGLRDFFWVKHYGRLLWIIALVGSLALRRVNNRLAFVVLGWFLGSVGLVVLQNRYFGYHWQIVFPSAAVLASAMLIGALGHMRSPNSVRRKASGLAALVVLTGYWAGVVSRPLIDAPAAIASVAGSEAEDVYWADMRRPGFSAGPAVHERAARYLRAHAAPSAVLGTWLYDPTVLYRSGLAPANRIFHIGPVVATGTSALGADMRSRLIEQLIAAEPDYFAVDHWYGQEGPPLALLSNAPRLDAFVNLRYRRVWFEGGLEILKRDLPTRAGLIRPVIK